jgi:hypothetical protein
MNSEPHQLAKNAIESCCNSVFYHFANLREELEHSVDVSQTVYWEARFVFSDNLLRNSPFDEMTSKARDYSF